MPLKSVALFYNDAFSPEADEIYKQMLQNIKERRKMLRTLKENISEKSEKGAKAVNIGFISEKLAPALKSFRFQIKDCRSLFDPIDFIFFEGLHASRKVSKIIFSDIKTGAARLSRRQKQIKSLVEGKKVSLKTYDGSKK